MYIWRTLSDDQKAELMDVRAQLSQPLHSPPHFNSESPTRFHLSGACYEHRSIIGHSYERMLNFSVQLLSFFEENADEVYAWCVLPNHWHALVLSVDLKTLTKSLGQLHGRTSFQWNREQELQGRQCWSKCADRRIRSESHFYAACNYIHNNPVKHGYVKMWTEWEFSSARSFVEALGRDKCLELWEQYPVLDMGEKWDSA
jgi:putative transposase